MGILDSFMGFSVFGDAREKANDGVQEDRSLVNSTKIHEHEADIISVPEKTPPYQKVPQKTISERILRFQIGSELAKKYSDHRRVLQAYSEKLSLKKSQLDTVESSLNRRMEELKKIEETLTERERSIEEREEEYSKQVKDGIKKYAEKKKKEIQCGIQIRV